jgi:hypothetical protein
MNILEIYQFGIPFGVKREWCARKLVGVPADPNSKFVRHCDNQKLMTSHLGYSNVSLVTHCEHPKI